METKVISDESIDAAANEVAHFLQIHSIEHCTIEYFFTLQEGIEANTFKITYTK